MSAAPLLSAAQGLPEPTTAPPFKRSFEQSLTAAHDLRSSLMESEGRLGDGGPSYSSRLSSSSVPRVQPSAVESPSTLLSPADEWLRSSRRSVDMPVSVASPYQGRSGSGVEVRGREYGGASGSRVFFSYKRTRSLRDPASEDTAFTATQSATTFAPALSVPLSASPLPLARSVVGSVTTARIVGSDVPIAVTISSRFPRSQVPVFRSSPAAIAPPLDEEVVDDIVVPPNLRPSSASASTLLTNRSGRSTRRQQTADEERRDRRTQANAILEEVIESLRPAEPLRDDDLPGTRAVQSHGADEAEPVLPVLPSVDHLLDPASANNTLSTVSVRIGEGWASNNTRSGASHSRPGAVGRNTRSASSLLHELATSRPSTLFAGTRPRLERNSTTATAPPSGNSLVTPVTGVSSRAVQWSEEAEVREARRFNERLLSRRALLEDSRVPASETGVSLPPSAVASPLWGHIPEPARVTHSHFRYNSADPSTLANNQWRSQYQTSGSSLTTAVISPSSRLVRAGLDAREETEHRLLSDDIDIMRRTTSLVSTPSPGIRLSLIMSLNH